MPSRIKYALFYDFHTSTIIPDVGRRFDIEAFTDQLVACGVDFLTWHARCNQGHAYYDTAIGKRHPSLDFDLFGQLVASCHRKGIKISAYFNGGLTDQELLEHRDWMRIALDGRTLALPEHHPTPAVRAVCYNSPFRDHLKAMAREVAVKYAVDGFFFDCIMDSLTPRLSRAGADAAAIHGRGRRCPGCAARLQRPRHHRLRITINLTTRYALCLSRSGNAA